VAANLGGHRETEPVSEHVELRSDMRSRNVLISAEE
jgi:hypothetical protein